MILDRLILFLFGKGPKAEKESAQDAVQGMAQNIMGMAASGAQAAAASQSVGGSDGRRAKRKTLKRKKRKTAKKIVKKKAVKKKAVKKKAGKKAVKKKAVKKAAKRKAAKKTSRKKTSAKKAIKKAKKKITRKIAKKKITKKIKRKKQTTRKEPVMKQGSQLNIHVVFRRKDKVWLLRREGMTRGWSLHTTQADAMTDARRRARRDKVDVILHAKDGAVRERFKFR